MRKILLVTLSLFSFLAYSQDKKISGLNPLPSVLGTEFIPVARGGANYYMTPAQLPAYLGGSFVPLAGTGTVSPLAGTIVFSPASNFKTALGSTTKRFFIGAGNDIDLNSATIKANIEFIPNGTLNMYSNSNGVGYGNISITPGNIQTAAHDAVSGFTQSVDYYTDNVYYTSDNPSFYGLNYEAVTAGYVTSNQTQYSVLHRLANDSRYAMTGGKAGNIISDFPTGKQSIDFNGRYLNDATEDISMDWGLRKFFYVNGSFVNVQMAKWVNGYHEYTSDWSATYLSNPRSIPDLGTLDSRFAPISYTASLSAALTNGYIFIGNGSNIATGVLPSLSATPGTFSVANTGVLTMPNATTSLRGLLTSTDWNTFNNKADAAATFTINGTGMALGTSSTVTAAAGTLTGSALNSGVTTSSLTTLGTVTSGTYNATIGTASVTLGSDATGDIYYRAAGGALTRLAAGGDGTWLRFAGAGAAPTVSTLSITNTATATYIPFATATNTWGESSTLTYSTSTGLIVSNTGSSGNIISKNGSTNLVTLGSPTSNPTLGMIWMAQASPSVTNYNLFGSGGDLYTNGANNIVFRIATVQQAVIGAGFASFSTSVKTSGATADWTFTAGAHTAQTASADVNAMQFDFATNNVQHATGALTQNNDFLIKARTHRFVAASTLSDAFTQYINGAPIAGTNATITRRWGLGVVGNAQFQNSVYIGGATTAPVRTLDVAGDIGLTTAGNGIYIKEGTNATMGTATLTAGTVVVSTTKVTASSRIFLTTNGGTLTNIGALYVSARSAGTSFTISSANILDASNVAWIILEPN